MTAPAPDGGLPAYAELHCLSSFSFQRGASHPEELVARAHALGYTALAITDECSVAGVVRAHTEAKRLGLQFIPGSEFVLAPGWLRVLALPRDLAGWGGLCEFITAARRMAPKGSYGRQGQLQMAHAPWALLQGCEIVVVPDRLQRDAIHFEALCARLAGFRGLFGSQCWLAAELLHASDDALWLHNLQQVSALTGVPLLAAGDVQMHVRSRKPLHDVMRAIALGQGVAACGRQLQANAEAHLRPRLQLARLYPPELLARTVALAGRCRFSLDSLRYHYPLEAVLPGLTPAQTLAQHTLEGAQRRYPQGVPGKVQQKLAHELALIAELNYEMYFLTVHDIVQFARRQGILCQGRGSAANSVVCYCLHITEASPKESAMLFERFISRERNEPPDIDVDFEHQRREEVIQYIYAKYGRERAAIAATVVHYRPRSALRDVGRALAVPEKLIEALCQQHPGMYAREVLAEHLHSAIKKVADGAQHTGTSVLFPSERTLALWLELSTALQRFPRHLSQHVGGFVLTQGPLTRLVPVENAAMPERSIVQWDKDDLSAMGLMKVDVLALGMLSAIRRCLQLVTQRRGLPEPMRMQDIPREDQTTYDMICAADTVGVFQIESRAQMSMLPRLKPRTYYDLVVEVAIVRPGPIQGGMVHPYLKARQDPARVKYPSEALKEALQRTLGVPIFQEQVMQIAVLAAGFTPGEADGLRRSMAAWKRHGNVSQYHDRLVGGMLERGYTAEFAEAVFRQMEGFGEYGFPESHAASFALLVYISSWLKCHEPACFVAALLNSQPLGFYTPSQLVQDARRHGVKVLPVDVAVSDWDCSLEPAAAGSPQGEPVAVRLGLRLVGGLREGVAQAIVRARQHGPFANTEDLALRAQLDAADLKALAAADALQALAGHRRQQVWQASALHRAPALLSGAPTHEAPLLLPAAAESQEVVLDYAATGLTLRDHPLSYLRGPLAELKLLTAAQLRDLPHGRLVRACGLVTVRQQPQTAKGVVFVTLEDETGTVNVIVWKSLREKQRDELLHARLLAVYGVWQRDTDSGGQVRHVVAKRLKDLTPMLEQLSSGPSGLVVSSRDFH